MKPTNDEPTDVKFASNTLNAAAGCGAVLSMFSVKLPGFWFCAPDDRAIAGR